MMLQTAVILCFWLQTFHATIFMHKNKEIEGKQKE